MTMTRFITKTILLAGLALPPSLFAQDIDVQADVAISVTHDQTLWAGQQITLNLDVKTTGFSFSNTRFNLPDVSGAFLMQTDSTTIKLTENINGQSWQIVRYPIALYPQKAGQLEIPPINVRFKTSAGFGSTEKAFEFQTRPLDLSISLPPGVKDGSMVITTTSFELSHQWQPDTVTAQTGDAFTLTVTRRAKDISAMLLPPLPVYRAAGLAAYPQAPDINDETNRGDLTGERIDSIIWVLEKPGSYAIPGIRFQWWDPDHRELRQQIIPGLKLDVLPSASSSNTANIATGPESADGKQIWLAATVLIALMLVVIWFRYGSRTKKQSLDSELSSFAALQKACKGGSPAHTHLALHAWLASALPTRLPTSRSVTLDEFSRDYGDPGLATHLDQLQEAVISKNTDWQGCELLNSLQRVRRSMKNEKKLQLNNHLSPLNP